MDTPKIRHLALFARNPAKLAKYYVDVFQMKQVHSRDNAVFLSDGYITMAILPATSRGATLPGLNHFGFKVDDREEILDRIEAHGAETPTKRPKRREKISPHPERDLAKRGSSRPSTSSGGSGCCCNILHRHRASFDCRLRSRALRA